MASFSGLVGSNMESAMRVLMLAAVVLIALGRAATAQPASQPDAIGVLVLNL